MQKFKVIPRRLLSLSIASVISASAFPVLAEGTELEEIITVAQKRPQSLRDVPISVSNVSGEKLDNAQINDLETLTTYIPNFSMNQTGIGSTLTVRGISSGINPGFEQSVGQYVDGIYYGRAQLSRIPFLDLSQIEVLRGPQGTLFGKNSIAGAVSLNTARPTSEFEGSITALYEPGDDEQDLRLVLSGPLSDSVRGRLAVLDRSMEGYVENTTLGRDEKQEDERVIRGSIEWDISENWLLFAKAERTEFDVDGRNIEMFNSVALPGGPDYLTVLNTIQGVLGRDPVDGNLDRVRDSNGDNSRDTVDNLTVELKYQLGEHTLSWISGLVEYDHTELCDCDFTGAKIFIADGSEDFEQVSHELRLTSPVGGVFDYVGGLFYQSSELDFMDRLLVPTDSILVATPASALVGLSSERIFTQDSDLWAAYFQGTWHINDDWRLTLGGRFTSEQKDASRRQSHFDASGNEQGASNPFLNAVISVVNIEAYDTIRDSRDENAFTPLVTMQWDVTDDAMLYSTWTKGFKSGGFDVRSNAHPDPAYVALGTSPSLVGTFEFDEEEATNLELGGKFLLLDGSAELNVAAFFTDYKDLQVSQFDGILGFNVTNAAEASIKGFEVESRWQATNQLSFAGSLSYLDFEYDKFPNSQCYFGQPDLDGDRLCDVSGERKEYTPEWRWTLVADHRMPIGEQYGLHSSLDLLYVDDYLWNPTLDPRTEQDSYTEVNARISLAPNDGKWELALVGKNLTNQDVVNYGGDAPLASLLTSGFGNAYYAFINRDRSVAIQAKYNF
ncbi:TonB-dependent receptor [Porticoccaceae bacterium LTM1]|nr:TonB-dependent receptor [Porticoccaceae bacterium LTM1]